MSSSNLRRGSSGDFVIDGLDTGIGGGGSALEDSAPPLGGIEGSLAVVEGGVDVAEEIPYLNWAVSGGIWGEEVFVAGKGGTPYHAPQ